MTMQQGIFPGARRLRSRAQAQSTVSLAKPAENEAESAGGCLKRRVIWGIPAKGSFSSPTNAMLSYITAGIDDRRCAGG
jgi:hypothetical protein